MVRIDLEYYKHVANTQNNYDILKAEFLDLIEKIENDPIYQSIKSVIKGGENDVDNK